MSMLARFATNGGGLNPPYVDDVFSTYLYTGNSSTQIITNGIDLAGEGGLVWIKSRSSSTNNALYDTARGVNNRLVTNSTVSQQSETNALTAFNASGFSLGADTNQAVNASGANYTSWTFRKAPKFFDVVTWTGDGTTTRLLNHNLGITPGMVIVKRTDSGGDWKVFHAAATTASGLLNSDGIFNTTTTLGGARYQGFVSNNNLTSTTFAVTGGAGDVTQVNATGGSYVAYVFAHDTAADGLIQCGGFSTDSSGNATVSLGWEPQFLIIKNRNSIDGVGWIVVDTLRGIQTGSTDARLLANATSAETLSATVDLTATGFLSTSLTGSSGYIYLAIRRPNKPPTTGTQVFMPTLYTGDNADNRLVETTIAPDMVWLRNRTASGTGYEGFVVGDRLRGQPWLKTGSTIAEVNDEDSLDQQLVSAAQYGSAFSSMSGVWIGNDASGSELSANINTSPFSHIALAFKRAPGFFDVVCYTGTGTTGLNQPHSLGVRPELVIYKMRSTSSEWYVSYAPNPSNTGWLRLKLNTNEGNTSWSALGNSYLSTSTHLYTYEFGSIGTALSSATHVAYLFASLPGVSKVGSYTGNGGTNNTNGTSQAINCGFSTGARFVLIKRTDFIGDWFVFDAARGINAASDPYLRANTTNSETGSADVVDPDSSGFVVNQTAGTNLNVTGAPYFYLAIA